MYSSERYVGSYLRGRRLKCAGREGVETRVGEGRGGYLGGRRVETRCLWERWRLRCEREGKETGVWKGMIRRGLRCVSGGEETGERRRKEAEVLGRGG